MAQTSTDYIDQGVSQHSARPSWMMYAELAAWPLSHLGSQMEMKALTKAGMWAGSGAATNAKYAAMRKGLWGRYMGPISRPGYYATSLSNSAGGMGIKAAGTASKVATQARYGSALNLMQRRGGGMFSGAAWKAAGRRGITKQFATLAASRFARGVYTGLNVSLWAPLIFEGTMGAVTTLRSIGRKGPRQEFGDRFSDTEATYTERQRSIRAITSSRLSTRSAIGNEAALMHR